MLHNNISFPYKYLTMTFFTAFNWCFHFFLLKKSCRKSMYVEKKINNGYSTNAIWNYSIRCLKGFLTSTKLYKYLNFQTKNKMFLMIFFLILNFQEVINCIFIKQYLHLLSPLFFKKNHKNTSDN